MKKDERSCIRCVFFDRTFIDQTTREPLKNAKGAIIINHYVMKGFQGFCPLCLKNENIAEALKTDCDLFLDKSEKDAETELNLAKSNGFNRGPQVSAWVKYMKREH